MGATWGGVVLCFLPGSAVMGGDIQAGSAKVTAEAPQSNGLRNRAILPDYPRQALKRPP